MPSNANEAMFASVDDGLGKMGLSYDKRWSVGGGSAKACGASQGTEKAEDGVVVDEAEKTGGVA
ncbi:hypothetical protein ColTof4_06173 [Colletotrichum tofieldiae]|nr:hypothetical protein ColTof3_01356 [Colletotrichum tofieldiae]GKT73750.1 hypothetical protein ColTof4_06173 [Colletotrichum tofieldiae]GKT95709.1 hypothetical protein Ct61P_13559 [Colletotrichum tofieldiae]